MKAVRLHGYHQQPVVEDVPEPTIRARSTSSSRSAAPACAGPTCTSSRASGRQAMNADAALHASGHENAGWVHEVGSAVTNVRRRRHGDPAPDARPAGCAGPAGPGNDMHCANSCFPACDNDGGMAEYLLTSARRLRQARPRDPARGRRRAGRRRHHRLPRGAQGDPAAVPGHDLRGHRRRRPRPHRHPVPRCAHRDQHHRGGPQPGRAQARRASSARTTPWSPTAARSTRCRT